MENEEEVVDPFDSEYTHAFSLITLMRIYDVGMAILNNIDHDAASKLDKIHTEGKLIGEFPWINPEDGGANPDNGESK